ncbi:MAG: adenylate cyclase [Bacteroidetes bacterium]|nr:MAG: adenylate cyclase [Bacteroidota bacterium]
MGIEIERKFLVKDESWKQALSEPGKPYRQGYMLSDNRRTVRVRTAGDKGFITIKGKGKGLRRPEFEYEIPLEDAKELLALCDETIIVKKRHLVQHEAHTWEVDVFEGDNAGLIVAEIELSHEDETFAVPDWAGEEVTFDGRYSNASLSRRPWSKWN